VGVSREGGVGGVEWRKLSALTIYVMSVAEFEGSALVIILVLV